MGFTDWLRKATATVAAYNPSTYLFGRAVDLVVPGDQSASAFETGVYRILGGDGGVGGQNPATGNYNPSWGDAWRSTADDFTPDYVYRAPPERGLPGTQSGHSELVGDIQGALPAIGGGLLLAAAAAAALALRKG